MVGSIVMFPPDVSGPPWTDVLIVLLTSLMESVAWIDNISAARLARFRGHGAILTEELRAGVDGDVAGVGRSGAAGSDRASIIMSPIDQQRLRCCHRWR